MNTGVPVAKSLFSVHLSVYLGVELLGSYDKLFEEHGHFLKDFFVTKVMVIKRVKK